MTPPCHGQTELFYSDRRTDQKKAVTLCEGCGLVVRCLITALDRHDRYGVWGATTPDDREQILKALRLRASA